ncbi:MAG TPA: pantetheine-phosphate adenylyltransferase [Candidatus Deferrimicrobium sp.]|nr:pantetheine-phosphate adenylyltransferase [Candidatus Deferrimicrobium sp.]
MNTERKRSKAIYPGTFDPITNGHLSLVERASHLFDDLVVAVARNPAKKPYFDFDERRHLIEQSLLTVPYASQVAVVGFDGLLADLALEMKADAIVRGLRAVSDFENEFQMALMNRKLARPVETVFLMPALSWVYLSSTIVKDVACHGGDIGGLVPTPVIEAFERKLGSRKQ